MKHSEEAIFVALSKGDKQTAQRLIDRMAPEERKSFYAIAIDAASMVPPPQRSGAGKARTGSARGGTRADQ